MRDIGCPQHPELKLRFCKGTEFSFIEPNSASFGQLSLEESAAASPTAASANSVLSV